MNENSLTINIDVHKGEVLVVFSKPIQWASLSADSARAAAKNLIDAADRIAAIDPPTLE
jgi:hypothetical protein